MLQKPVVLKGATIYLEPLSTDHEQGLIHSVQDGELWELNVTLIPEPEHVLSYINSALQAQEQNRELAFAIIDRQSNQVLGSTRYRNIDIEHKCLEIGATFIAKHFQGTLVNKEAKYLLLQYAFESLHINRVEFITDELNLRSQKALESLGAIKEGILREHRIMPDWRKRNSLVYSINRSEWEQIKGRLSNFL